MLVLCLSIVSAGVAQAESTGPAKLQVNKTMMKNFLKSLIIPGWGQWENGHKIKAITFITAEVAGIAGYKINYSEGESSEKEFKAYGDEHWYYGRMSPGVFDERCSPNLKTHEMPVIRDFNGDPVPDADGNFMPIKDHHFYENISKYPEFVCGWDDILDAWEDEEKTYTPNKLTYIKMRTHSNELYKNAQLAGTLIMVNHLISAFDAALGTDLTTFETTSMSGKFYINPLNAMNSISVEVKF